MQLHPEQLDEAELPRDENTSFLLIGFWEFHEKNQEGAHVTIFFWTRAVLLKNFKLLLAHLHWSWYYD